jgi:hypothetical protein
VTWPPSPAHIPLLEVPFGQNVSPAPQPSAPGTAALLAAVAAALTACETAGITVKLKHGAVMTSLGYVLPLGDGTWGARTLTWTEFSVQAGSDDED